MIWQRVRRLNRYVEERAPWQLARDPEAAGELDADAGLAGGGGARRHRAAAPVHARRAPSSCSRRSDAPDARVRRRGVRRRRGGGARVSALEPLFPKRCVIDSHTHLDLCEPPDAELVAAAVAAGVTRMLTVGTDGASCRAALRRAEDFPQVYAAVGRHPNSATGFDDADLAELRGARRPRALRGDRRDGPRLLP